MVTEFSIRVGFLVVLLALLLGISFTVFFQNRSSIFNRLLALELLLLSCWQFAGFLQVILLVSPLTLQPLQMIFGGMAGYVFLRLARSMAGVKKDWFDSLAFLMCSAVTIYYVIRIFYPDTGEPSAFLLLEPKARINGMPHPGYVVYTAILAAFYISGLFFIVRSYFGEQDDRSRKQLLTVVASIGVASISGIVFVNGFYILNIPMLLPLERFVMLGALCILAYSVLGQQAWSNESLLRIIQENERSLAERNRIIESELDLARLIHHRLFPEKPPRIPGYEIQGACISTDKVGGDFYDFYTRVENLGVFIADVSGHGIPAAFIASCTKMAFNHSAAHSENGSQLLKRMDVSIARRAVQSMYVTAVYIEIDYASREMSYCNAGHCPILLHRRADNSVIPLKSKGSPLGLMTGKPFELRTFQLLDGDRIVLFTDGLTESIDLARQPFGEERLRDLLITCSGQNAADVTSSVMQEILTFTGKATLEDDTTIVIVDVLPRPGESIQDAK
ncbi:MAG: serine/threonine-protein phosphatase [Spirochaetia bacterium]|nr:serine/threonine-protein phosphatase [Spirochaetia bacterium]